MTILVPDTAIVAHRMIKGSTLEDNMLIESLEKVFQIECEPVARAYWNREAGEISRPSQGVN
jgi:hypothetical protein